MLRYLEYHSGPFGYGIRRKGTSLPLATGTYVHEALADILLNAQVGQLVGPLVPANTLTTVPESAIPVIRTLIRKAAAKYIAEVEKRGYFDVEASKDNTYMANEQATLVEGLCWAWVRIMLPLILREFEIIRVEQEEAYVIDCTCVGYTTFKDQAAFHTITAHAPNCQGIAIQSKPDIILRQRSSGRVGNHDFKTTSSVSETTVEEYKESVQMTVGTMGAEVSLREPIDHYFIHVLIKGSRKVFSKKGIDTSMDIKRQYSHFCYVKLFPPNPPFTHETTWAHEGYWYDKTPVWEADMVGKPAEMSNVEWVVSKMKDEQLFEVFVLVGPYDRPTHMLEQAKAHMLGEERRWIHKLNDLWEHQDEPDFNERVNREIPRSYNCHRQFGSRCQMYDICFNKLGGMDPIASGKYVFRRPHHQPEIDQMVARGIPVPDDDGEIEE